ncbi:MAG: hypothetical protein ACD_59C00033G0010 [uncultured bacterium]|nr:MAG: hypothetical protein ACD_59C00033G0010 [uncultured bacterium]
MEVMEKLTRIFCEVFDDDTIKIDVHSTANDVEGWDSLSHVNLIVSIEKRFKIKFETKELLTFKNVGDLRNSIEKKIKAS